MGIVDGVLEAEGLEVTIEVHEIEPMLTFYKDVLGFQDFGSGHIAVNGSHGRTSKVWAIAWGSSVLKLVKTEGVQWPHENPRLRLNDRGYGFTHITMKVLDGPALVERVEKAGAEVILPWTPLPDGLGDGEPTNGIAYFLDPEGNLVEPQKGWPYA